MSVEPTRPEANDENTTRIPLTPPPPNDIAVDAAGTSDAPGAPDAPDATGAKAPETAEALGVSTNDRTKGGHRLAANDRAPVRPRPRTGPIVWGALILVFCGYVSQQVLGGGGLDAAGWITATTIGLGVLLLGVGFGVLIRSRRDTQRRP